LQRLPSSYIALAKHLSNQRLTLTKSQRTNLATATANLTNALVATSVAIAVAGDASFPPSLYHYHPQTNQHRTAGEPYAAAAAKLSCHCQPRRRQLPPSAAP